MVFLDHSRLGWRGVSSGGGRRRREEKWELHVGKKILIYGPTDRRRKEEGRAPILGLSIHTIPAAATLGSRSKLEGEGIPSFSSSKNPRLVIPFRVGKGEMARGDYIGGGEGSSNNNPFLFPADHKGKKPKFMQDIFRMNESGKTPQFEWKTWDQRGANYSREKKKPNGFFVRSIVHPCQPTLWYVICCTCHPPPCAPEHKRGISRGENMQRKRG